MERGDPYDVWPQWGGGCCNHGTVSEADRSTDLHLLKHLGHLSTDNKREKQSIQTTAVFIEEEKKTQTENTGTEEAATKSPSPGRGLGCLVNDVVEEEN